MSKKPSKLRKKPKAALPKEGGAQAGATHKKPKVREPGKRQLHHAQRDFTPRPPAGWTAKRGKQPHILRVVTYNVLATPTYKAQRIPALLRILERSDADVIALQETTGWFLRMLWRTKWAKRYMGAPLHKRAFRGLYILSRWSVEHVTVRYLPSRAYRGVLIARLRVGGKRMDVATIHLDSYLNDGPIRAKQLTEVFGMLKGAHDAVLLGDFNFGAGEQPETSRLERSFVDLWSAYKPKAPGYTWDIERSPMAKTGSFPGEKSRRIDRILLRSKRWTPHTTQIIGGTPISPTQKHIFPSDHFGLYGEFKRK